jgi:hypothetical protein
MFNFRTIVLGLSAAAIAVLGVEVAGSHADPLLQPGTTCNSTSPCTSTTNSGSGSATSSTSLGGNGSLSTTKYASTSSATIAAGILGVDLSATGKYDDGVEGVSVRGTGVSGVSTKGDGVSGTSKTSGIGVFGTSPITGVSGVSTGSGYGVEGTTSSGTGVEGIATSNGYGISGAAANASGIGVAGSGGNVGVEGFNTSSGSSNAFLANGSGGALFTGVSSSSATVFQVDDFGDVTSAAQVSANDMSAVTNGDLAIFGEGGSTGIQGDQTDPGAFNGAVVGVGAGGLIYQGVNSDDNTVFAVDNNGNIGMDGDVTVRGRCAKGCSSNGGSETRVVSYAPRESEPTMEDVGEAQLVDGRADVPLDPAFANVIDGRSSYLVFITPEGDSHGLYIAAKTGAGFSVRENEGGHASIAFEYRIVAKPYGDASPRLPVTTTRRFIEAAPVRKALPKQRLRP